MTRIIWEEKNMLKRNASNAQGLVEYALILMLVTMVVLLVVAVLGPAVGNLFSNVVYNF